MSIALTTFQVTGVSSLLMNNPASMSIASTGTEKATTKKIPTPEAEAAAKVYRGEGDQLFIRSMAFRAALLSACMGRKIGKLTAWKLMSAGVFCAEDKCYLEHPKTGKPIKDYIINTMRAVVQRSGVLRSRPEVPKWSCKVAFDINDDFVSPEQVLGIFDLAGKIAGVGDYRVERKGPYGRFDVKLLAG